MTSHVLVAVDDSEPAQRALRFEFEEYPDSRITALHVMETTTVDSYRTMTGGDSADTDTAQAEGEHDAETLFDDARAEATERGRQLSTEVVSGDPSDAVLSYVEANGIDRIVIGTHGRSGPKRLIVGSVAEDIVRKATVPVVVP